MKDIRYCGLYLKGKNVLIDRIMNINSRVTEKEIIRASKRANLEPEEMREEFLASGSFEEAGEQCQYICFDKKRCENDRHGDSNYCLKHLTRIQRGVIPDKGYHLDNTK